LVCVGTILPRLINNWLEIIRIGVLTLTKADNGALSAIGS
jgi:hypothetical protein